jgi:ferritin
MAVVESEETSEEKFVKQWSGEELYASELYERYRDYCFNNSLPYAKDASWFCKSLQKFVGNGMILYKRDSKGAIYSRPA